MCASSQEKGGRSIFKSFTRSWFSRSDYSDEQCPFNVKAVMENTDQVYVSYYIGNNFEHLKFVELRKGLEVCGMLTDVYVSRNRNVRGQVLGFARFSKVRDVDKLKNALNNIYIRDFGLFVNTTRFDRFDKIVEGLKGSGDREK